MEILAEEILMNVLSIFLRLCAFQIAGRTLKEDERGRALSPLRLFQLSIHRTFDELFPQVLRRCHFAKRDGDISESKQYETCLNKLRCCLIYSRLVSLKTLYSYQLYNVNTIRLPKRNLRLISPRLENGGFTPLRGKN